MAQGLVLSLYVRLHRVTGDEAWIDAADRIFESFRRLGSKRSAKGRPWVSFVGGAGYLWLEHYPTGTPDHVLNAHLHAVVGLYEYWQHSRRDDAQALLEGALTTIRDQDYRYRKADAVSRYGLRTRSNIFKYHKIHVWQLRFLGRMTGDPVFKKLGDQMSADRPAWGYVSGRPALRHQFRPFLSVEQARRLRTYPDVEVESSRFG